jgi:hypothetical protein
MLRAVGATGLRLARSFATFHSHASLHPHFGGCDKGTLRVPLSQPPKHHIQPERYVPFFLNLLEKNHWHIMFWWGYGQCKKVSQKYFKIYMAVYTGSVSEIDLEKRFS